MYTTYTTDAVVVNRVGIGEADLDLLLYTKDFGMIHVKATGARLERSKLRFSLQTLSLCRVSLVRGVRGWRLTGAYVIKDIHTKEQRFVAARVMSLLNRFVRGAQNDAELFKLLEGMYGDAVVAKENSVHELSLVAGLLYCLGYVAMPHRPETLSVYESMHDEVVRDRSEMLRKVNAALHDSHL